MDLIELSPTCGFHLLDAAQDCRGWNVFDDDGNLLGRVEALLVDVDGARVAALRLDSSAVLAVEHVTLMRGVVVLASARREALPLPDGSVDPVTGKVHAGPRPSFIEANIRLGRRAVEQGDLGAVTRASSR